MNMLNSIRSLAAKVRSAVVTVLAAPFKPLTKRINTYIDQRLPSANEVAEFVGIDNVAAHITDHPDFKESMVNLVEVDASDVADYISVYDISQEISIQDVAYDIPLYDLAQEIDSSEVAEHIEVDPPK